ncbi:transposase family protein [Streptomyces sp. BA2]|uniref:transposase family protein n=1 Tax=Streptomyces sp. BA2 TaxID=436595 RepID=UPI001324C358|nr:hypothetical protein [Streptomyces sp. BA2]
MDGVVSVADLLFPGAAVEAERLSLTEDEVLVAARARGHGAVCPECGWRSSRVRCYYERRLAGRPVAGRRLQIRLRARRFTCENTACSHRTFAEQIPALTRRDGATHRHRVIPGRSAWCSAGRPDAHGDVQGHDAPVDQGLA